MDSLDFCASWYLGCIKDLELEKGLDNIKFYPVDLKI